MSGYLIRKWQLDLNSVERNSLAAPIGETGDLVTDCYFNHDPTNGLLPWVGYKEILNDRGLLDDLIIKSSGFARRIFADLREKDEDRYMNIIYELLELGIGGKITACIDWKIFGDDRSKAIIEHLNTSHRILLHYTSRDKIDEGRKTRDDEIVDNLEDVIEKGIRDEQEGYADVLARFIRHLLPDHREFALVEYYQQFLYDDDNWNTDVVAKVLPPPKPNL